LEGWATLITAIALLITSISGIVLQIKQSGKLLRKTDDVHTIVNSQRTEMIDRIEQLETFIRKQTKDSTPPPGTMKPVRGES
jgi:hypothetical protein